MKARLLVGAAIATGALMVPAPAGAQDPPSQVGWWSSDPTAASQPEGGFHVSAVAGQATAVAALRFATPSGTTSATLTLREADGGFVSPATALQVCVTSAPWEPANPGAMDDAPEADCTAPATLERDPDALTWTAQVGTLLPSVGGEPSLMIVPATAPSGGAPVDPGFRVSFAGATLAVVAAPGTTTPTPTPSPSSSPGFTPSSPGGGGSSPSSGGLSPPPAVTPTTAGDTTATLPVSDQPATGEAFQPPDLAAGATPGGGGGADQPWERLLFLVPLAAAIGVGSVYARKWLAQRGVVEA